MPDSKKIIFLAGGGSGGPVTPLFALARQLRDDFSFMLIGTSSGPEKALAEAENAAGVKLDFLAIRSGKLRRYFSWKNILDIFNILAGLCQSFYLIAKYRPAAVASAGGFVAVPLIFAAWACRVPVLVHQQDVRPGLANRLCAPFASVITVVFEASKRYYGKKAVVTGNPIALPQLASKETVLGRLGLELGRPLLLVLGGGTGSKAINDLVIGSLDKLLESFQVVHIAGAGKSVAAANGYYRQFESIGHDELLSIMNLAEMVVSRCGLGVLSEISLLGKAAVLIPMPDSHQEDNAAAFAGSALVLSQKSLSGERFSQEVIGLWQDKERLKAFRSGVKALVKQGIGPISAILKKIAIDKN